MNKIIPLIIVILVILSGAFLYLSNKPLSKNLSKSPATSFEPITQKADFTASYEIFTNGTFRIFTDPKYHNLSEEVFIQENNPNIIYVKKSGITWDDFFKTLPMKLTKDCLTTGTNQTFCTDQTGTLKFYINGVKDDNALDKKINADDKLLVTFGNETEDQIKLQLDKLGSI